MLMSEVPQNDAKSLNWTLLVLIIKKKKSVRLKQEKKADRDYFFSKHCRVALVVVKCSEFLEVVNNHRNTLIHNPVSDREF